MYRGGKKIAQGTRNAAIETREAIADAAKRVPPYVAPKVASVAENTPHGVAKVVGFLKQVGLALGTALGAIAAFVVNNALAAVGRGTSPEPMETAQAAVRKNLVHKPADAFRNAHLRPRKEAMSAAQKICTLTANWPGVGEVRT
ncbi:MAG: hypothetical protein HC848_08370, partial [Limnobacter sp.]|nr:hypothetical protein [Limnobacter sp.]